MGSGRQRVLVAGHDLKFFRPLQQALEDTGRFEFRQDVWQGHDWHDPAASRKLLEWAEIVICEWCLGNAVWYSRHLRPGQHLVTRFHLQERVTEHPRKLKLENMARIIFVGAHIEREAQERMGLPPAKTCVIPNIVDVDRFDRPKHPGAFFNLGMIGTVPRRKRMDLALDLLAALKKKDDRYCLHIKGPHPASYEWLWARTRERRYYIEQYRRINSSPHRNSIVFDPPGNDVPEWLQCVGFVLSPSDFESFHMAVSEGMASGGVPILWDWEGAGRIHGEERVVHDVEGAARRVEQWRKSPRLASACDEGKEYVREHFGLEIVRDRWCEALENRRARPAAVALPERTLVVVYAIDNWPTFHRREMLEALAAQLRDEAVFLIIEPGSHFETLLKQGWADLEELQAYARLKPLQVAENIYKFRSLTDGFRGGVEQLLERARGQSAKDVLHDRIGKMFPGARRRLHWLYKPELRERWLQPGEPFLYECYDDYTRDFGSGRPLPGVAEVERATLEHAQAAFFTSTTLLEEKGHLTRQPILAENGVAFHAFARHRLDRPPRGRPRVGYLGNLSDFFDWEAVLHAARELTDVSFELLGPVDHRTESKTRPFRRELERLPNCTFAGRVDRDEGARRIAGCHALLIPFVRNAAMDAVNPLKLWEYFATGRPVVTTPLKAIQPWFDLVYLAGTRDDWTRQIRAAVEEPFPGRAPQRIQLAEKYAWDAITATHAAALREVVAGLRSAPFER
ncbi:MAG: glycosyltransferase [bacterium]